MVYFLLEHMYGSYPDAKTVPAVDLDSGKLLLCMKNIAGKLYVHFVTCHGSLFLFFLF